MTRKEKEGPLSSMPRGVTLEVISLGIYTKASSLSIGDRVVRLPGYRLQVLGFTPRRWLEYTEGYKYDARDNSVREIAISSRNIYRPLEGDSEWE